jgi:hypothetical protein
MHANAKLVTGFYEAFNRRDPGPMRAAYAPNAVFSDAVFPNLEGPAIGDMWSMLCERAQDFRVEFRDAIADDSNGSAHWEAYYLFGGKRHVHNILDATFTFSQGLIVKHHDAMNFWRWSRQALGPLGVVLGWSGLVQRLVQSQSRAALAKYQQRSR